MLAWVRSKLMYQPHPRWKVVKTSTSEAFAWPLARALMMKHHHHMQQKDDDKNTKNIN